MNGQAEGRGEGVGNPFVIHFMMGQLQKELFHSINNSSGYSALHKQTNKCITYIYIYIFFF